MKVSEDSGGEGLVSHAREGRLPSAERVVALRIMRHRGIMKAFSSAILGAVRYRAGACSFLEREALGGECRAEEEKMGVGQYL